MDIKRLIGIQEPTKTTKISTHDKSAEKSSTPQKGEVLEGEIVDLNSSEVKIKLTNGQVIGAKLTGAFEFHIGQQVQFLVKESLAEQLLLKPVIGEGEGTLLKLQQILAEAGFVDSEENLKVIEKLLEQKMPIDRATVQKVITTAKQAGYNQIDTILFLVKNNIPATRANIEQFNQLIQGKNKIMESLAGLSVDIAEHPNEVLHQRITEVLLKDSSLSASKTMSEANQSSGAKFNPEAPDQLNELQSNIATQNKSINHINALSDADSAKHIISHPLSESGSLPLSALVGDKTLVRLTQLLQGYEGLNLSEGIGDMTLEELLGKITSSGDLSDQSKLLETLRKEITTDLIQRQVFAGREELESPEKLSKYFDHLHEKISQVIELTEALADSKSASITKEANHLKNSLEFYQDLNQKFNILQMPLLLGDQLTHSELYIFNEKHQLKNPKGTVTALIRLDLVNLRHVDIHVSKTEKNLTLQFFAEDKEQRGRLEAEVFKLHNQLQTLGFKVQGISVTEQKKDFNILEDFLEKEKVVTPVKRYTFDIRA